MRANGQLTGMLGVYLTAAELTRLGYIVSPTSRSAFGADLLVTDRLCHKAWSVQVKTNGKAAMSWLVNAHVAHAHSENHVYVSVNLKGESRPEYFVVPSLDVARIHKVKKRNTGSIWYFVDQKDTGEYSEGWSKVFEESAVTAKE